MKKEKLEEGLREVLDEIEAALHDSRGLLAHQRRLAYGAPSTEKVLQDKINLFFELKRIVQC